MALKGRQFTEEHKRNISRNHHNISGDKNPNWRGGQYKNAEGYIFVCHPSHPQANKKGYIQRSHLVIKKVIKRHLKPLEIVHHKNGIRDDDRPENLQLFSNYATHNRHHLKKRRRDESGRFLPTK